MIAQRETIIRSGAGAMVTPYEAMSLYRGWYVRNGQARYDGDILLFAQDPQLQDRYKKELELQEAIKGKQREQNELNAMQCSLADRRAQLWAAWEADSADYAKSLARFMDRGAFRFNPLPIGLRDRVPPLPKDLVAAALEQLPQRENTITEKERSKKSAKLEKDLVDIRAELEALHDPRWNADVVGGRDSRTVFIASWRETQKNLNAASDWLCVSLDVRSAAIKNCWKKFLGPAFINHNGSRPYDPNL
jgi:hypothetical protein